MTEPTTQQAESRFSRLARCVFGRKGNAIVEPIEPFERRRRRELLADLKLWDASLASRPVDIISGATFNFQFASRADEVAQPEQTGKGVGDAVASAQISATYFEFKAEGPRYKPWNAGDTIGFVTGGGAGTVLGVRPRRPGGS